MYFSSLCRNPTDLLESMYIKSDMQPTINEYIQDFIEAGYEILEIFNLTEKCYERAADLSGAIRYRSVVMSFQLSIVRDNTY